MSDEVTNNTAAGTIGDLPEEGQDQARKKKKSKKKSSGPILIAVIALALLGVFMIYSVATSGSEAKKPTGPAKSKELLAQEAKLQKNQAAQEKSLGGLRDKLMDNPDVASQGSGEGNQYSNMLQFLNTDPQKLATENVIAQEEMRPEDASMMNHQTDTGLRSSVMEQGTGGGSRAIYRTESSLDPKLQKEDYEAEKQTFFAYSTSYKGATVYDGAPARAAQAVAKPTAADAAGTAKDEDEFAGKSEAEIRKTLEARYTQEAADAGQGGGGARSGLSQKPKVKTAVLTYSDMAPVKCFEGQFLDCVLLHKLVSDTEESPVVVAVAKDFFDSSARYVVIPTGTRVIGRSQVVSYQGASRLYVWFERMIFPNGVSVDLPASGKGLDVQGSLGVVSSVNRHFWAKFGTALMVGLLDGLGGLAQSKANNSQWSYMINDTSDNMGEVTRQIVQSTSNIVPTITVYSGHRLKIALSSDLVVSAYALISDRSYARGGQ
ncbi:MAG TPA: TrbI/VirB10 family protein [Candidatus Aminicenantes bacterium]|nr:TrbI/VirB10 family protein [Candidatus Aminicenantes bacterium]